jgi:hypothetical protein
MAERPFHGTEGLGPSVPTKKRKRKKEKKRKRKKKEIT